MEDFIFCFKCIGNVVTLGQIVWTLYLFIYNISKNAFLNFILHILNYTIYNLGYYIIEIYTCLSNTIELFLYR